MTQTFSFDEIEAVERLVDVVATRESLKAGVEVLAGACRPSDLSAAFDQFRLVSSGSMPGSTLVRTDSMVQ